jgi:fructose-1,6-bisphosphatase/inositol monophosphatase family enzyme
MPPWLDHEPSLPAARWRRLIESYCARVDAVVGLQSSVVADERELEALEWDLETDLLGLLRNAFGGCDIYAEERFNRGLGVSRGDGGTALRLVVDPIDGSRLYREGSDRYTSTFAVFAGWTPVAGIVYQPATGLLFSAARGLGAFRDDQRIPDRPQRRGVVAIRATGDDALARSAAVLRSRGYEIERLECTSLKLAWLADGTRSGVVKNVARHGEVLRVWGMSAGLLVALESGAAVRNLDGSPWRWREGVIAVGGSRLHESLRSGVRS